MCRSTISPRLRTELRGRFPVAQSFAVEGLDAWKFLCRIRLLLRNLCWRYASKAPGVYHPIDSDAHARWHPADASKSHRVRQHARRRIREVRRARTPVHRRSSGDSRLNQSYSTSEPRSNFEKAATRSARRVAGTLLHVRPFDHRVARGVRFRWLDRWICAERRSARVSHIKSGRGTPRISDARALFPSANAMVRRIRSRSTSSTESRNTVKCPSPFAYFLISSGNSLSEM